jgi:hypothetical protein
MPSIVSKPAYLIEGDLEQLFIQNVCPKFCVRRIGLNGDNVSVPAIAKRVGTLVRLLQRRYRPIIVIFDREARSATCDEIERELRDCLRNENIDVGLIVGIPDRDVENWILADYDIFCECSGCTAPAPPTGFEGVKGKTKLKKLLSERRPYIETIDGVQWLKRCRANKIAEHSLSFAKLMSSLQELPCWWLESTVV